jgi:pentatricopeptide repeat protein
LEAGRAICDQIQRQAANTTLPLINTSIDMFAKCGCVDDARRVFDGMKEERSEATWNAMLAGYAHHGRGQEAIFMYSRMQDAGLMPADATFSSILSACSHEGLRSQAYYLFCAFIEDHLLFPAMEHYSCMVDLLGRAGCLSEGREFIESIPVQPDPMLWMALLGTCKYHANVAIARSAFASAIELEPGFASCSILSKIFRAARCNRASHGSGWD